MNDSAQTSVNSAAPSPTEALNAAICSLRIARLNWHYIVSAIIVCLAFGGFYYFSADKIYEARAEVLVEQTGPLVSQAGHDDEIRRSTMMPTYERLFTSIGVLEMAAVDIDKKHLSVDYPANSNWMPNRCVGRRRFVKI